MIKKILFIIPSLQMGGTISSLNSIYLHYRNYADVYVLPLSMCGDANIEFRSKIVKPDLLIGLYTTNYRDLPTNKKLLGIFVKLIKRICLICGIDNLERICNRSISKVEKKHDYDIVVGFQEGISTFAASFSKASKKIAWIHCNYDYYVPEFKEEESVYSKFNNIVCVSRFTSLVFSNKYCTLKARITYIYNFLNTDYIIHKSVEQMDDIRFSTDKYTILSVGRIHPIKRFRYIPLIAKELLEHSASFVWYLIGPVGDIQEMKEFEKYRKECNVADHVYWLGSKSNPYPYLKASDLLVCLSESEACPMIFNEAKLLGTPIVTTDFGSASEFVCDGVNGDICSMDNISSRIASHLINPSRRVLLNNDVEHLFNKLIMRSLTTLLGK